MQEDKLTFNSSYCVLLVRFSLYCVLVLKFPLVVAMAERTSAVSVSVTATAALVPMVYLEGKAEVVLRQLYSTLLYHINKRWACHEIS